MWVFLLLLALIVIAVIIAQSKSNTVSQPKNEGRDYWDDKIINQALSSSTRNIKQRDLGVSKPLTVDIEKYHSSNDIIGKIQLEYIKKYHESDAPICNVDPNDMDDYIQRFHVTIWNSELDIEKEIVGYSLYDMCSKCEAQFKIWSDKVEKKNSPESSERRIQANRKYLSENKKKLKLLDTAATYKQHQELLNKMQLRYNEIIASGYTFKESQLAELKDLGLKIGSSDNSKLTIPDMMFEVKGLTYRSVQAQLEAVLLEVDDELFLEEEPDNDVDPSAVKVLTSTGECIGYVDKEHCVSVGALISLIDRCTVAKKSRHQIPFITAKIKFKE